MKRCLIIVCLILLVPSFAFGARRALLIGINDYPYAPGRKLYGCLNDVKILKDILIKYYGFSEGGIKTLTNQNAKMKDIINTFEKWLVEGTKEGDLAVFYYSGHGSRVEDFSGDELDKKDELLCPYDTIPTGGENTILDDELGVMLRRLKGRDVVVIIDACHSGGHTRRVGTRTVTLEETPAIRIRYLPITDYRPAIRLRGLPRKADEPEGQISLAASKEDEVALEINNPGYWIGGFTLALVKELERHRWKITYRELFHNVKKYMRDTLCLPHSPQLLPLEGREANQLAFVSEKPETPDKPQQEIAYIEPVIKPQKEEVLLLAIEPFKGATTQEMKRIRKRLQSIPYIKVVTGRFFDRLLRGEVVNGRYKARILNRIGDVVEIPMVDAIDKLVDSTAPYLEYAYIMKRLIHLENTKPSFKVNVWVTDDRRDFRLGETVTFNLSSEKDCYIVMLNLDSQGNFTLLFPNRFYPKTKRLDAGKTYTIPDEEMEKRDFQLQFHPPAGEETVKVIATTEPIDLKRLGIGEFEELFFTVPGAPTSPSSPSRDLLKDIINTISVKEDFEWSEDVVVIRSYE